MEITNVNDIVTLINNKVALYIVCPLVYNGKIINNKIYEINRILDYGWGVYAFSKDNKKQFAIMRRDHCLYKISQTDVINTNARIFTTEEDAKKGLAESLKAISYSAIKSADIILKRINEQKKKLNAKEEKFKALKKQYFEMSVSKFSK